MSSIYEEGQGGREALDPPPPQKAYIPPPSPQKAYIPPPPPKQSG